MKEDVKLYLLYGRWLHSCISGIVSPGGREFSIVKGSALGDLQGNHEIG